MTKNKITISRHQFNFSKDLINPIATLGFTDSKDLGFTFRSYNMEITCRFNKHDYYNFIHTLLDQIIDDYEITETASPLLEDFMDYIISKFTEE